MLTPVQFDDEFLLDTYKIRDVVPDGMLPSKIDSQLIAAYDRPQFALSEGKFLSQIDGAGSGLRVTSGWAWHFCPS